MTSVANNLKTLLALAADGRPLSRGQAREAFDIMMSGDATPAQMGGFLMALRVRGETVEEITGAVDSMRAKMLSIEAPPEAMDIVGTGGDATGTYNISTTSQFVVTACGVPVAKHGNRALSSKSGAADVLTALGINIDADMSLVRRCLAEAGTCFMMAPRHHSAMRHVGPVRVELGTRTIFNLLGPMANPAKVKRQLTGVFAAEWVSPLAEVLKGLGSERAWVVHGAGGMDELSTTGQSMVAELKDGVVSTFEVGPQDGGLERADFDDLKGGEGPENARALRAVLDGQAGPYRDIVLFNAAAALVIAEKAGDLRDGVALAAEAIDSGGAAKVLDRVIAISNEEVAA